MLAITSARSSIIALALVVLLPWVGNCDGSKLAVGDVVMVGVDGEKDFTKEYQLNSDGSVSLPMGIKPLKLEGLNTSDAAAELTKALTKVLINPQVSVSFVRRAGMQVFVVGQVKKSGLAEIGIGDRVLQALAQAGYDETSDLSRVNVRRGDEVIDLDLRKYLSGEDLSKNIVLQSGDTIVVPRTEIEIVGSILMTGEVTRTGPLALKRGMTFREAMGLIGGVTVEADPDRIIIRREKIADPIKVDYKRAMDGDPAADTPLQPGDVVYVPQIETSYYTLMGGVNRPGQFPFKGKMTLTEAIGAGGGPIPNSGDMNKVQVVRSSSPDGKGAETLTINLNKIHAKAEVEPLVRRGDVITVALKKQRMSIWEMIRNIMPLGWIFR